MTAITGVASPAGAAGASIRIFLVDGTPDGLGLVEKSNWTGVGIVCPRSQYTEARRRPEFARPGVYVLTGPGESALPQVYVGEAGITSVYLQGIDSGEIIDTVHHRPAPVLPASAALR